MFRSGWLTKSGGSEVTNRDAVWAERARQNEKEREVLVQNREIKVEVAIFGAAAVVLLGVGLIANGLAGGWPGVTNLGRGLMVALGLLAVGGGVLTIRRQCAGPNRIC